MISWLKSITLGLMVAFALTVLAMIFAQVAANDLHATHTVTMATLYKSALCFVFGLLVFGLSLGRWIGQNEECGECGGSCAGLTWCQLMRRILVAACFGLAIWQGNVATNLADGHEAVPHLLGTLGFGIAGTLVMAFDYWWEHRNDYDETITKFD
jgi:hypothetical protein